MLCICFFDERATRKNCEAFLKERFELVHSEIIPTRKIPSITEEPIIWRYFVSPLSSTLASMQLDEKEFVARTVIKINTELKDTYVFSSGKNMCFLVARIWEPSKSCGLSRGCRRLL